MVGVGWAHEGNIYTFTKAKLWDFLSSHSCYFVIFKTILLHAYVKCICIVKKAKYQTAPSKAVVGVDIGLCMKSEREHKHHKTSFRITKRYNSNRNGL